MTTQVPSKTVTTFYLVKFALTYILFFLSSQPVQNVFMCIDTCLSTFAELTHTMCVIQFEAAEDLVNVSGMEKTIASHHHLETLWDENKDHTHI